MTEWYCDCDSSSYPYRSVMRKAAKPHKCCECGFTIKIGDRYQYVTGLCEGSWFDCHTCKDCVDLIAFVTAHVPCLCIEHHNALEKLDEVMREVSREVPGLWMEYGRKRIGKTRKYRTTP